MADFDRESMLEMFTFEMNQLVDQLEQIIIESETGFSASIVNEIFRIMHTIKGSAAMMLFDSIANATHVAEDLFFYLREESPTGVNYSELADHVLACMDFIKEELAKISENVPADGNPEPIIETMSAFLAKLQGKGGAADKAPAKSEPTGMAALAAAAASLDATPEAAAEEAAAEAAEEAAAKKASKKAKAAKEDEQSPFGRHRYKVKIRFDGGAQMENVRAYTVLENIKTHTKGLVYEPEDLTSEDAIHFIRKNGFVITFSSDKDYHNIFDILNRSLYIKDIHLEEYTGDSHEMDGLQCFDIVMKFDEGAQMENVRSYAVINTLKPIADYILYHPPNLLEEGVAEIIQKNGLRIDLTTAKDYDEVYELLMQTIYLKDLILEEKKYQPSDDEYDYEDQEQEQTQIDETEKTDVTAVEEKTIKEAENMAPEVKIAVDAAVADVSDMPSAVPEMPIPVEESGTAKRAAAQALISVSVSKLDQLLKLMGELVIVEAMVTQSPDLEGLELENFSREARQLKKIIKDVQETVMAMRLVSLSATFFKMNRLVRDMCKALRKEAVLDIVGENTEVDKNIIEHIGDPIMHIVRNSLDHGIEMPDRRKAAGKPEKGRVLLEARNAGNEVWIIIKDDGQGLSKDRILEKARNAGLLNKPENEYSEREVFQFIFRPGFSTNDQVTTYSGRGVGMDVVNKNLEFVGGSVTVDSEPGEGSTFIMKIPLTLTIVEGMIISVAGAKYTVPIVSIKDSFRPNPDSLFLDPNGNEMITVRGDHYNVVRLNEFFGLEEQAKETMDGIMMIVENGEDAVCLFVDDLIGEQQVVVKSIPKYIKKIRGLSGCTLLGNGEISLILDVAGFFDR
jgi:two-component system chemotaxis sensor kinase CheA